MQTTKKCEFNFDELRALYNALTVDIKRDKEKLVKSEIKNLKIAEAKGIEEYKRNIYEAGLQRIMDHTEILKDKVCDMIQDFGDGTDINND